MRPIYAVILLILIIGGLNWGVLALTDTHTVASLLGLIGVAALIQIGPWLPQLARDDGRDPTPFEHPDP
jgi:uncharacterized membrane protein YuzA (DUF378 family)